MRLLLDTHAFIWSMGQVSRLPDRVAEAIRDPHNEVWLSAVSLYEIEYKRERDEVLGRLPADLISAANVLAAEWLAIVPEHAVTAGRLDRMHKDPWDRLIVAQARVEGLSIVSVDPAMKAFGVETFW
ncbi:type II toxin-antitoxin system VapC family toxin [Brevundimonas sp.]|uniref:type II toxin-antitoxin system VapC family toxin n=1 Tax=Brevundimonas sp. TaxID=1871086 RepID=UPI002AB8EF40|nr:type II toxin-antitoxin system VapC family toxin [Brevundimonas sp.]MDZ4363332.1 type II toxin-antitoxin system VapC family toxin [Brevundimonas sp.]